MKRYSTLPRNYLRRPEIRGLVPDLKLLMLCVYVSCESHVGAFLPGGLSEESGLEAEALAGGLADLIRRGLLVFDESTGEVFISSFFRDNVFNTPARRGQAVDDFKRVESQALRNEILAAVEKNPGCGLTPDVLKPREKQAENLCFVEKQSLTLLGGGRGVGRGRDIGREVVAAVLADQALTPATATTAPIDLQSATPHPNPNRQPPPPPLHGVKCWDAGDQARVRAAVERHGSEAVSRIAGELATRLGKLPLPSHVEDALAAQAKEEAAREFASITQQVQERQDVESMPREQSLARAKKLKETYGGGSHV